MDGDIIQSVESLLTSCEAFGPTAAQADRVRLLAKIREQLDELRSANEEFHKTASEASAGSAEAEQGMVAIRDREAAAVEVLYPRILSLQGYLTDTTWSNDRAAHELLQEAINVAVGYMSGYQNVRDRMLRPQADQQSTTGKVLRARPVKGEIDYAELSREHMARYPKIRAALAK